MRRAHYGLAAALFLFPAASALGQDSESLKQSIGNVYETFEISGLIMSVLLGRYAVSLFVGLMVIDIALWGARQSFRQPELNKLTWGLIQKLMLYSLFGGLIILWDSRDPGTMTGQGLIDSFQELGQRVSGLAGFNIQGTFSTGLDLMLDLTQWSMFLFGVTGLSPLSLLVIVPLLLFLLFIFAIGVMMTLTLFRAVLAVSVGKLFLAFAGFHGTARIADSYLGFLFRTGIQLFIMYFVLGVANVFLEEWNLEVRRLIWRGDFIAFFYQVMTMWVVSGILAFTAIFLPRSLANALIGSGPVFGLAEAVRAEP